MDSWRHRRFAILATLFVFSLAALAYCNTLANGFVFDDRTIIERNPSLRSLEGLPRLIASPYWSDEGRANRLYRPLTLATYALNRAVLGTGPLGFHLVNTLLHGVAAALLYHLLLRLFGFPWMALGASALFAVHPALSESVAGLVGRADILATVFLLCSLLLDRKGAPGRTLARSSSLACFFLALLSKENAVAFPGLLILTDFLMGRPKGISRRTRGVELLAFVGVGAAYLLIRRSVLGSLMETSAIPEVDNLLVSVSSGRRVLTALALAGRYVGLFLFPLRLSADYSARQIEPVAGYLDPMGWLGIILAAALAAGVLRFRRLTPLAWGLGFFAVALFPVSNIPFPIGTIFAERLLYLPAAGLCACAAFVTFSAAIKRPRSVMAASVAVLALLTARTWARNRDWRDDFSLFRSAAEVSPRSARVRYNLGNAYRRRGELIQAEESYRECLRLYPHFDPARRNLGVVLSDLGKGDEAIAFFREALRRDPKSASLHNNLGNALRSLGRIAEAEGEYRRALEMDPSSADAHNNLGVVLPDLGQPERAEAEYRESIRLSPERMTFRINLGNFLLQRGDLSGAERVFQEAAEREPFLPEPHRGLGEAFLKGGESRRAELELERSLSLDPSQWEAPALLGFLHQERGEGEKAIRFYLESLSRKPDQPELEQNLGVLYASMPGGREEALRHLKRCLDLRPPRPMEEQVRALLGKLEGSALPGS